MQGKPLLVGGGLVLIAVLGTLYWRLHSEPQGVAQASQADNSTSVLSGVSPTTPMPTEAQLHGYNPLACDTPSTPPAH